MTNKSPHSDWFLIGDWLMYRYGQFVAVLGFLLFGWWIVKRVIVG